MKRKFLISALIIMLMINLAPRAGVKIHAEEGVKLSNQSSNFDYFEEIPIESAEQETKQHQGETEQIPEYFVQRLSLTREIEAPEEDSTKMQEENAVEANEESFEEVTLTEETEVEVEENFKQEEISSTNEEASTVSEEPVEETTITEESDVFYTSNDGIQYKIVETIEFTATAYCHCQKCCDKAPTHPQYGFTASGVDLLSMLEQGITPRIVAADTSVLPFGTKIYVEVPDSQQDMYVTEDYGFASVEDRGGAIKNKKIDVYFPTDQEALEWGRRTVLVHILAPVS